MEMVWFVPAKSRKIAILAAQADSAPVLLCGTQGSGKSAIARWIHQNSPRSSWPLVTANRDEPLETQMARAQNGTFVIQEVGEWPLTDQSNLLRFLKTKAIAHPEHPETRLLLLTRIIATSSQNLDTRTQGGLFSSELLSKLSVFRIDIPDLCKRTEEFEDIALALLREIAREFHRGHIQGFSLDAWERLKAYYWPGNIRELRNVLRVAVPRAREHEIQATDLPDFDRERVDFQATREEFEKTYIVELLKNFDWQIDRTCQVSRMDRSSLLAKIKKYGITPGVSPMMP